MQESLAPCDLLKLRELFRRPEAVDRVVFRRGLQILPNGQEIDARRAQVIHHLPHIVQRFAQPDHQAGFGENLGTGAFGVIQKTQRGVVARAGTDRRIKMRHRFEVVVEDIRRGIEYLLRGSPFAQEIRRQHLDGRLRRLVANGADGLGDVGRTAIVQIIAIHAGDHHMPQAQFPDRRRHAPRLEHVERIGPAGGDIAERTAAGTDLAHDHHRGVPFRPAFADIGAGRLLADGDQVMIAHQPARLVISLALDLLAPDPTGLARNDAVWLFGLFRVAGTELNGHWLTSSGVDRAA